jgi:TRAP-type transport system periplasmic protein
MTRLNIALVVSLATLGVAVGGQPLTLRAAAPQRPTTIRLASLAPARSVWDNSLQQMRSDWEQQTQGRVRGIVFPTGQQGDDAAVLLKMKAGTLDAAALTLPGLCKIDDGFNVLGIPLFYESYDELNHVTERLTPMLRQRLESRGFVLLNWGHAGWIRVFTTRPARTLSDLKGLKWYTTAGDDRMVQVFQRRGFHPIALPMTGILTGLTSGMIEAVPTTPTAMLFFQWYGRAKYMLDVPLAPLVGATVVSDRVWRSLSEADRAAMMRAARAVEVRLAVEIPRQDDESIRVMRERGLTVTLGEGSDWAAEAQHFADAMKGMVPDDLYAAAVLERRAFREHRAGQAR